MKSFRTIMAEVAISASPTDIYEGSEQTLRTLRSGLIGQFGRISAEWRRLVMLSATPDEINQQLRTGLISNLPGVRGEKPPANPRGTMYFSKLKPEVGAGRRPGDIMAAREALYRGAARAADVSAVGTRIGSLPPISQTLDQFLRMNANEKDALLKAYGVKITGTRAQQYARLYAVNR